MVRFGLEQMLQLFISILQHWAPMHNYLFYILVVFGGTWNIIHHYESSWWFLFCHCLCEHVERTVFYWLSVTSV